MRSPHLAVTVTLPIVGEVDGQLSEDVPPLTLQETGKVVSVDPALQVKLATELAAYPFVQPVNTQARPPVTGLIEVTPLTP
jgi:hypothetical protein